MKIRGFRLAVLAALALGACISGSATAVELKLMIEPNYSPKQAAEVYKPLLAYLTKATGHTYTLIAPRNYHFFWRDLRGNTPVDLMFCEAHFADFRIKRWNAVPLARTVEKTSYTLVTTAENPDPTLRGMLARNIVTMSSPSLGYALLVEFFPNPVAQPNIMSTATSWRDGLDTLYGGDADAAIVPTALQQQDPALVAIQTSREFPGAVFTASGNLDPAVRDSVTKALLALHEDPDSYEALVELGVTQFEPATAEQYAGSEQMLKEFFGYQ